MSKKITKSHITGKFIAKEEPSSDKVSNTKKEEIGNFVKKFYAKHGGLMSRLAHE